MSFADLRLELTTTTDEALRAEAGALAGVAREAGARHDELVAAHTDELRRRDQLACRSGCSHCCHMEVGAMLIEVIAIAEHVEDRLDAAQLAALDERLERHAIAVAALAPGERAPANLPCPLLIDASCSVYEVRPLACRGWNSADVVACEQAFADRRSPPPTPVHSRIFRTAHALSRGIQDSCRNGGVDGRAVELGLALRRLRTDAVSTTQSWLRGQSLPEDIVSIRDPQPRIELETPAGEASLGDEQGG